MKFSKEKMKKQTFPAKKGSIHVFEYTEKNPFMIDGAVLIFNGLADFKVNENFDELVFVISGELKIVEENSAYTIEEGEMCIIKKGIRHSIEGHDNTKAFIVCNPPFDHNPSVEYS